MEQPMARGTGDTRDSSAANPGPVRGTAICAGLGGLLLVAYAILMNLKPRGCIAEECVGQSYRAAGPLEATLVLTALGLMIATAVGLFRMHRFEDQGARMVRIAALVAAISLFIGLALTNVIWWAGFAAFFLAMLSFAAVGAGLMRSRVLPPWSGAMLIVTSLLVLIHNDQNERILLLIPFGVTWMVLAGLLWFRAVSPSSRSRARIRHA